MKPLIRDIIVKNKQPEQPKIKPEKEKIGQKKPASRLEEKPPRFKIPRLKFSKLFLPLSKLKLAAGIIIFVIFCLFGIILLGKFSSITVEITPRQEFIEIDAVFGAGVEPAKNELAAEVMSISRSEKGSVRPTGLKQISRRASGQIMIYNTYSSDSQILVKNTRFEAPDGKIYLIDKTLTIPGTNVIEGKVVAGEIEATVFADEPGENYNADLVDFIIPGFQNSVKREKFYGRAKTKMEGGFVGEVSVIKEGDIASLQSSLQEKIKEHLLKTGVNPKPEEFLFYDNAKQIVFSAEDGKDRPKPGDESGLLELEESAVLYGFLFKKTDISEALAEKYFEPEIASQVELINSEKLDFEIKKFTPTSVSFRIKGSAHFVRKLDENQLKNDLALQRKNTEGIFQKYPAIEKARVVFKPNWWRFVPKKTERMSILLILKTAP